MRLLLDTCVSPRTRDALLATGHDAVWTGDWDADPGDEAILEFAYRESRILITLDEDFGELAVVFGKQAPGGGCASAPDQAGLIFQLDLPLLARRAQDGQAHLQRRHSPLAVVNGR